MELGRMAKRRKEGGDGNRGKGKGREAYFSIYAQVVSESGARW